MLAFSQAKAQSAVIQDITNLTSLNVSECGAADTMTFTYRGVGVGLTSVSIADSLPDYIRAVGYVPSANIVSVNLSDPKMPIFDLDDVGFITPDTLRILVQTECGANIGQSDYKHYMSLSHSTGNHIDSGINFISAVKAPVIQLVAVGNNNVTNGELGESYERNWKIQNTGVGSILDSFLFTTILEAGITLDSLSVEGIMVTPSISGDTARYGIGTDLRNVGVFPEDTIRITEYISILACTDATEVSTIKASWGCYASPECAQDAITANVQTPNSVPNIQRLSSIVTKSSCFAAVDTAITVFTNTGGTGSNWRPRFNIYGNYGPQYFDTAGIEYSINGGPREHIIPNNVYFFGTNFPEYGTPAAPPYRVDYLIPIFKAGDTITFYHPVVRVCPGESGSWQTGSNCRTYLLMAVDQYQSWQNACGTVTYQGSRAVPVWGIFRSQASTYVPTDMVGTATSGDTATFKFLPIEYSTQTDNFSSSANRKVEIEIEVPTSLKWDKDTASLNYLTSTGTLYSTVDEVEWDSVNGTLKATYYGLTYTQLNTGYQFPFNFYVDCSAGPTGKQEVTMKLFWTPDTACSPDCRIGIFCRPDTVNIHCPGPCPEGGISPERYTIERKNYGLPDNDDNGFADAVGSIDLSKIRLDRISPGDTLISVMKGKVVYGAGSPASFTNGYATFTIPVSGNDLSIVGNARVDVYRSGTLYTATTAVSTSTSGSSADHTVDMSIASLTYSPAFPTTGYLSGDSVVVTVELNLPNDGNLGGSEKNVVSTEWYLSDMANPVLDTDKYECDNYSGQFELVDVTNSVDGTSSPIAMNSCGSKAIHGHYTSNYIAAVRNAHNYYPYEVRPFYRPDSLWVDQRVGWQLDSAKVYIEMGRAYGNSTYVSGVLPVVKTESSSYGAGQDKTRFWFSIDSLWQDQGGTLENPDEHIRVYMYYWMSPTCGTENGDNQMHSGYTFKRLYDNGTYNFNRTANKLYRLSAPTADVDNYGAVTVIGNEKSVYWEVAQSNTSLDFDAENAWISIKSPNGSITVDSVIDVASGTTITPTNDIYPTGTLGSGAVQKVLGIHASFTGCDPDSLIVYSGFNCTGYPTDLASFDCEPDSVTLLLEPAEPQLQTTFISRPPRNGAGNAAEVNLCDTLEYVISVSQRKEAVAYDLLFDMVKATGLVLIPDSVFITYPATGSEQQVSYTAINSRLDRIDVSNEIPAIGTDGLAKFSEAPNNEYLVRVKYVTTCDFVSGRRVRFRARGTKPCGESLPVVTEQDRITITGAPSPQLHETAVGLSIDTFTQCSGTDSLALSFTNNELVSSTTSNGFSVLLPYGIHFVTASTQFSKNAFTATAPSVTIEGSQERLSWIADGVPANDSSVWKVEIEISDSLNMCGAATFEAETTFDFSASCGGTSCTSSIINATSTTDLVISRPILSVSSSTTTIIFDTLTGSNDSLLISLELANTGFDSTGFSVRAFQDPNSNGILDPTELLLYDLNKSINGSSVIFDTILVASNGTFDCPVALDIVPDCDCNSDTVSAVSTCNVVAVPVTYTYFNVVKESDELAKLTWQTASELNNLRFDIERRVIGNPLFTKVGEVQGNGTSNRLIDYNYQDDISGISGTICYRFRQVDYNGDASFSDVRCIENKGRVDLSIYPNPSSGVVNLTWGDDESEKTHIEVTDIHGNLLFEVNRTNEKEMQIDLGEFANGIYFLRSSNNDVVHKIIKVGE